MREERAAGSWTAFPVAARCGCSAGCCALAAVAVVVAYQTAAVVAAVVAYQTAAVVGAVVADASVVAYQTAADAGCTAAEPVADPADHPAVPVTVHSSGQIDVAAEAPPASAAVVGLAAGTDLG